MIKINPTIKSKMLDDKITKKAPAQFTKTEIVSKTLAPRRTPTSFENNAKNARSPYHADRIVTRIETTKTSGVS